MKSRKSTRTLFFLYTVILLLLLFWRQSRAIPGLNYTENLRVFINVVPFRSIAGEIRVLIRRTEPHLIRYAVTNLYGNILLFIPLGFFLPLCFSGLRSLAKTLSFGAAAILLIELLQLVSLLGCFDIDDLLLNTFGITAGYGVYKMIKQKEKG